VFSYFRMCSLTIECVHCEQNMHAVVIDERLLLPNFCIIHCVKQHALRYFKT